MDEERPATATDLTWPEGMGPPPAAPESAHHPAVVPGEDGDRWIVSVMGGAERLGQWKVARRCRVVNVMGGADVDFTNAQFADGVVDVGVYSLMGGADIYIPEHVNVEVSSFAFMGGNGVKLDDRTPNPGGPTIRLRLVSVMGGADVKRGPKRSWRERLRRRRAA